MRNNKGQSSIVILFVVALLLLFFFQTNSNNLGSSQVATSATTTISCRPEEDPTPVQLNVEGKTEMYRLIKPHVLIQRQFIETVPGGDPNEDHMNDWGKQNIKGEDLYIYTPKENTNSEGFPTDPKNLFSFDHINLTGEGYAFATKKESITLFSQEYWFLDVYLKVGKEIPDKVKNCQEYPNANSYVNSSNTMVSVVPVNKDNKQLQMGDFKFSGTRMQVNNWWTPACKPVVYLYPEKKENVLVKLDPKGFLLETIPEYPKEGWFVESYPSGKIVYKGNTYDYLYYESKIRDEEIEIPKEGFVVAFPKIESLFQKILPKTGLNEKESKEFIDYWKKALPNSPYYFIGLMEKENIDKIEPLTILPHPENIIRVRFYFKALDKKIEVSEPVINEVKRGGFTVVEWGGMVKTDKDHPFTCSQ